MHEKDKIEEHIIPFSVSDADIADLRLIYWHHRLAGQKHLENEAGYEQAQHEFEIASQVRSIWDKVLDEELQPGEIAEIDLNTSDRVLLVNARRAAAEARRKAIKRYEKMLESGFLGRFALFRYRTKHAPQKTAPEMREVVKAKLADLKPFESSVQRDLDKLPVTTKRNNEAT